MLTMTSKLGDNKIVETTIVGSEAVSTMNSERAANALLTESLERLRAVAGQVLRDMEAQDVLMEWQTPLDEALMYPANRRISPVTEQTEPAIDDSVKRQVRPRAWLRVSNISGEATGLFETQDVQLQSERLEPLYDQAALDAAVAAERERFLGLIERHNNDSFMASVLSDSVRLGMDASGVKA